MNRFIVERFNVAKILRQTKNSISVLGIDRESGQGNVVVKLIRPRNDCQTKAVEDFFAWCQSCQHPLIAPVIEAGWVDRHRLYVVRPFYSGTPLDPLRNRFLSCALLPVLFKAISFLHRNDIIHGSLKPSNVILTESGVRLLDGFGYFVANEMSIDDIPFAAPEVLNHNRATEEADLYSFGAFLYSAHAGCHPFKDGTADGLTKKYLVAARRPLADVADVSNETSRLATDLLAEPSRRRLAAQRYSRQLNGQTIPSVRSGLIARNAEVEHLMGWLEGKRANGLSAYILEGQAGIGKTRLVEEVRRRSAFRHRLVLPGRSFQRDNRPLEPFIQIIESAFNQPRQNSHWLRSVRDSYQAGLAVYPELRRKMMTDNGSPPDLPVLGRIMNDFVGAITTLCRLVPACLVFEDVQWCDEASRRALELLVFRASESPVRVILSCRPSALPYDLEMLMRPTPSVEVWRSQLTPLDERDTQRLAANLATSDEDIDWIVKQSGGNPLFAEECARTIRENDRSRITPLVIRQIVTKRLCELPEGARLAAEVLCLFPRPATPQQLAVLGAIAEDEMLDYLRELVRQGMVAEDNSGFLFRHEEIRQQVYQSTPRCRRRRLHEQVLLGTADRETLGFHATRAGKHRQAFEYLQEAASAQYEKGNFRTAALLYKQASQAGLKFSQAMPVQSQLREASCLMRTGSVRAAQRKYHEIMRSPAADGAVQSTVYAGLAFSPSIPVSSRIRLFEQSVQCLPPDSELRPVRLAGFAQELVQGGDMSKAQAALQQIRSTEVTTTERTANYAKIMEAFVLFSLARYREAISRLRSAKGLDAYAHSIKENQLAICLEQLGDLKRARHHQQLAFKLARSVGYLGSEILSLVNAGAYETKAGRFQTAAGYLDSFSRLVEPTNRAGFDAGNTAVGLADLAALKVATGGYRTAYQLLRRSLKLTVRLGFSPGVGMHLIAHCALLRTLGLKDNIVWFLQTADRFNVFAFPFFQVERLIIEGGMMELDTEEKIRKLTAAVEESKKLHTLYQRTKALIELGRVYGEASRNAEALECVGEALRLCKKQGYRPLMVQALLVKGSASPKRLGLAVFLSAYRLATEIGMPEYQAQAAARLGALLLEAGDMRKAQDYLLKSVAGTQTLVKNVPRHWRVRYLAVEWRKQALENLTACVNALSSEQQAVTAARLPDYFRLSYEVNAALQDCKDSKEFVPRLRKALYKTLKRPVVVALFADRDEHIESAGRTSADAIPTVKQLRSRHQTPFFGTARPATPSRPDSQPSVAWIPLAAVDDYSGGIYSERGKNKPPFTEPEMEFLTLAGSIASAALARLLVPPKAQPTRIVPQYAGIVGRSKGMLAVFEQIQIASKSNATILIQGESGTGKELVARAIHRESSRTTGPFVPVDCGAIPESLIESELFGSKKGSFTGAVADRPGLFEAANAGTLFLDEVGNTIPAVQAKLLRVLQEREVRRIGETKGRAVDVRLIVATNCDLDALVRQGRFRQDLLFRLKVLHVSLPPLRTRREDIAPLAQVFLNRLNETNRTAKRFAASALRPLAQHSFPGNVRELQNLIERAYYGSPARTIGAVRLDLASTPAAGADIDEIQKWFNDLSEGRANFWVSVQAAYKRRDISRERVTALMDYGLRATRGNYKAIASMFGLKGKDYRRFMDFLRRSRCRLDFREYRKA